MTANTPKPTLSVKLHTAEQIIAAMRENHASELKVINEKLTSSQRTGSYDRERSDKALDELAQIHSFLDAVPCPPARSTATNEYGGKTESSAMTRLSVYLATRSA